MSKKEQKFTETRLVYGVQRCSGKLELSEKREKFLLVKFYSSRQTSAFGNPLVRDQEVLVSDERTSGSFLP